MQLKIVSFFCFLLAFASHLSAQQKPKVPQSKHSKASRGAAKLHTFIVADESPGIGSMVDYETMQKCVENIATQSGLTPVPPQCFKKADKNAKVLKAKLESLTCGSDDAVFFYYSGHGFNAQGSEFTSFQFDELQFSMDYVTEQLSQHKPRLLVVMYDACNFIPGDRAISTHSNLAARSERLKTLFRNSAGTVKIASNTAGVGKFSIGFTDDGGLFTNAFYAALENAPGNSWESVLTHAKTTTTEFARKWRKEQIPFFKNDTHAIANAATDSTTPVEEPSITPQKPGGTVPKVQKKEASKPSGHSSKPLVDSPKKKKVIASN
jgi:Caspase domain